MTPNNNSADAAAADAAAAAEANTVFLENLYCRWFIFKYVKVKDEQMICKGCQTVWLRTYLPN